MPPTRKALEAAAAAAERPGDTLNPTSMPPTRKALEAAAAAAERPGDTLHPTSGPAGAGADLTGHGTKKPMDPGRLPASAPDTGEVAGGAAAIDTGSGSSHGARTLGVGSPHDALTRAVASRAAAGAARGSCDADSVAGPARVGGVGEGACLGTALPSGAPGVRMGSSATPAAGPAGAGGRCQGNGLGVEPWVGERCEAEALRLEAAHVHSVYESIAAHFSATRFAIWPKARWHASSCPGIAPRGIVYAFSVHDKQGQRAFRGSACAAFMALQLLLRCSCVPVTEECVMYTGAGIPGEPACWSSGC